MRGMGTPASLSPTTALDLGLARVGCLPVLKAERTLAPYPLLGLLRHTTLLREQIHDGLPGVPLGFSLRLLDPAEGWQPIARAAVYCWHGACQGVQISNLEGVVRFRTIYPALAADGVARLRLQIFVTRGMHVCGVALADVELPAEASAAAQAAGPQSAPSQPEEPAATPIRLRNLSGDAQQGFSGLLTLGITT